MFQTFLNRIIDSPFRILAVFVRFSCRQSGQNFNAVVNGINRPNMETSFVNGLQNIFAQHQRINVGARNNHTLVAG